MSLKLQELNAKLIKAIENIVEDYLRKLTYDRTLFGEVTGIADNKVNVKFNGDIHNCRIKDDITILVGDMVIVKQLDYPNCKYYVDGKLK